MTIDRDKYDRLHVFARRLILHDPEDLVQDAWLSELEDPKAQGEAYLKRSLKFRWRARHRSDSRRRRRESAWASEGSEVFVAPVERFALERALGRLTIEQRRLIEARFIEGREPREIAAALGLSPEVVRQRLHRALVVLRRELDGEQRRVLFPIGWRRLGWSLAAGAVVSIAVVGMVCVESSEDETREPDGVPPIAADVRGASPPAPTPNEPVEASTASTASKPELGPTRSPGADLLGAAWLIREYREGYGALMKEVQASFIGCMIEHNQNPPEVPVEMTGKTVFRVQLRSEPDTGVFAEAVERREDTHAARELIECIGESLPTLEIDQPSLEVPAVVVVVVEGTGIITTSELDLSGMPEALRDDVDQLRRIGRYLSKGGAPGSAEAALAEFAVALADGIVEPGEVDDEVWTVLRGLADPP